MVHHTRKFFKKLGIENPFKLSKPYSVRFTKDNETYIKAQPNREKFINELITERRQKEMEITKNEEKWRKIIYGK